MKLPALVVFISTVVTFVLAQGNDDVYDSLEDDLEQILKKHMDQLFVSDDVVNHRDKR